MQNIDLLDKLTSVFPSERQLDWQETGYYNFVHFGMTTMIGKEWGDGKASPSLFDMPPIDTDAWVKAFKASGSRGVILVTKHHDGFCLFPSKHTDYTIAASPYMGGKGDVVKQLSDSCKKFGMKFGVYLSPWDRHEKSYGTPAYNDFFCKQLKELMTGYGEIFEVWFDGACGEGPNGKKQEYAFETYFNVIRRYQPKAVIAVCGPDVRWIGNEGGKTRKSEWSVVSARLAKTEYVRETSQQSDAEDMTRKFSSEDEDLGSREALANEKDLVWYPSECDVSITVGGWFWHKFNEIFKTRSARELVDLYYNTTGNNGCLLLNVPPNKKGNLPKKFVKRLAEMGSILRAELGAAIKCKTLPPVEENGEYIYDITARLEYAGRFELAEDVTKSQRIEEFRIEYRNKENVWSKAYEGTVIGYRKIAEVLPVAAERWRIVVTKCRKEPCLKPVKIYKAI